MLGVKWAKVIGTWERIERDITIRQRKPSKINLAMKFKIVAAVVMFLALGIVLKKENLIIIVLQISRGITR